MPFANQQRDLTKQIESMLDELAELSTAVQMLLVDDASIDGTYEILDDLRRTYPQIMTVRLLRRLGASRAVESVLGRAEGEFIFLHESYEPLDLQALNQLWALRHDRELVVARASTRRKRIDMPLVEKLATWGKNLEMHWKRESKSLEEKPLQRGLQMMRRDAVENVARIDDGASKLEVSHLSHRRVVRRSEESRR
jgi:glycosyltransferase involved in cell wall biosynthesis